LLKTFSNFFIPNSNELGIKYKNIIICDRLKVKIKTIKNLVNLIHINAGLTRNKSTHLSVPSAEEDYISGYPLEELSIAFDKLPSELQELLYYIFFERKTYVEIEKILHSQTEYLKLQYRNALGLLRNHFKNHQIDED